MANGIATMEEQRMARLQQARFQGEQENGGEENKTQKAEQRINNVTAGLMIITALAYDAVQAFLDWILIGLVVNWILDIWAWLTFFIWFKLRGVSFANPKRAISLNGGFIAELIPAVNALPIWTAAVIIMVITVKTEDKLASISPMAAKAFSTATGGK
jgi:hypothetical protein